MARKLTHKEVKTFIEIESKSGCTLISNEYSGAKKPLEIECSCSNLFTTTFNTFKHNNKRNCDQCSMESFVEKIKQNNKTEWNYDSVRLFIESFEGYKLLSPVYVNTKEKLNISCPMNHEFKMNLNDFKTGHRCNVCKQTEINNSIKHNLEYVKTFIEVNADGYALLSNYYEGANSKLEILCKLGHVFEMTFHAFKDLNQRCSICAVNNRSKENHWNWQGGIAPERSLLMIKPEYKNWRLSVFKRDNFTCQCCGNSSKGDLEAHHLENFSNNESLRYEISNGVTLCKYCHNSKYKGSFHNIYGTHNINTDMFNEYLFRRYQGEFDKLILLSEGGEKRIV